MTCNETFVLMMALQSGGALRYHEVFRAVHGERASTILRSLHNAGAMVHSRYGHWEITEKGRIAAALAMSKDVKLAQAFGFAAVNSGIGASQPVASGPNRSLKE